jgi:threonine/homoserine/homoserine lactone efflux protein
MPAQLFLALILFSLAASFTPGPNNLMVMASGVNFGLKRSLAHVAGVCIGFTVMVLLVGLGLGFLFSAMPVLYPIIKYVGIAYLLYLAWKIANAGPVEDGSGASRPLTFIQAAAFQWVNPKGWTMAVGAVAAYAAILGYPFNMIVIAAVLGVTCILSTLTWLSFGTLMRRFIRTPGAAKTFNVAMALLLVASVLPVLLEG